MNIYSIKKTCGFQNQPCVDVSQDVTENFRVFIRNLFELILKDINIKTKSVMIIIRNDFLHIAPRFHTAEIIIKTE